MKAMIFAAGIGKRLQPISEHTPKALVKLGEKTMLQLVAEKLIRAGASRIVVNIYHHPEKIQAFISKLHFPEVEFIISDETGQLLDTGGGLLKARPFLEGSEPIILHNVDVLSDIDLLAMLEIHKSNNALATLAATRRKTSRYFLWDQDRLAGWENTSTGQMIISNPQPGQRLKRRAFSGIHMISPELLSLITETGVFSINDVYLRLAKANKIIAFEHKPAHWADIGTPEKLENARKLFEKNPGIF
jgi:NDP-sugar pyrophosphorylase family protein